MAHSTIIEGRNTPQILGTKAGQNEVAVKDAVTIKAGHMQAKDENGEILEASDTLGLRVLGRLSKTVDNTTDGHLAEAADAGIFRYKNGATFTITADMKGMPCYVEDSETVASSSTNLVPAGIVHDVDSDGVWVVQDDAALSLAIRTAVAKVVAFAASAAVTAAQVHQGNVALHIDTTGGVVDATLPTAQAGFRIGIAKSVADANAAQVSPAAADTVLGGSTQIANAVNGVSQPLWLVAVNDTAWVDAGPTPGDLAAWVAS